MGILVAFILFAIGTVLVLDSDFGCSGGIFGIIALILCIVICTSGVNLIGDIKAEEKVIISEEVTTRYELVPLDFAIYEKDPELTETNASPYFHISDKGYYTFYYKTAQNGVEGFIPGTIYYNDVFFPSSYIGEPKILEITTTYKYTLTWFQKIWLFGTGLGKEKTVVNYEIYIPENPTFNYEQ